MDYAHDLDFYNDTIYFNNLFYESHKRIIELVAMELNSGEKSEALIEKFLGKPIKFKKRRDPYKPKRAKTSYFYFCDDERPAVLEKNPGIAVGDQAKILGKMWQKLTDDYKVKYKEMHEKDAERYSEEFEEYLQNKNNAF